ncbi:unnamed protein product [Malus baccata var. baccata]
MNEFVRLIKEAWSKPISLTHQIASRVDPFTSTIMQKYDKSEEGCKLIGHFKISPLLEYRQNINVLGWDNTKIDHHGHRADQRNFVEQARPFR